MQNWHYSLSIFLKSAPPPKKWILPETPCFWIHHSKLCQESLDQTYDCLYSFGYTFNYDANMNTLLYAFEIVENFLTKMWSQLHLTGMYKEQTNEGGVGRRGKGEGSEVMYAWNGTKMVNSRCLFFVTNKYF